MRHRPPSPGLLLFLILFAPLAAASPPAQRVVTLSPHATELVIAAGGAERLVAAVPADRPLPPGVVAWQTFGGLDRERLLALRPDLIVTWPSGMRAEDLAWLRTLGVSIHASDPPDLDAIARDIRRLGRLLGSRRIAEASARRFLAGIRTPCANLPAREVYVEIWPDPPLTLGGRHWLNQVLRLLGLRNTFGDVDRAVFRVAPESLLLKENLPRVVLRDQPDAPRRLGSALLARPGPRLAEILPRLCERRLSWE